MNNKLKNSKVIEVLMGLVATLGMATIDNIQGQEV